MGWGFPGGMGQVGMGQGSLGALSIEDTLAGQLRLM